MLVVSLMVSQKCWDDVSLNNVDFPQVWKMVAPHGGEIDLKDVNFMEREFLSILGYKVAVGMRLYTSCYYEIMALALLADGDEAKKKATPSHFEKGNVRERYKTPSYYLVGNNNKYMCDEEEGDEGEGSDYEDAEAEELLTEESDDEGLVSSAKRAHSKFERRNTVDVLAKSPPRNGSQRSITMPLVGRGVR